jgi:hypothetical protein
LRQHTADGQIGAGMFTAPRVQVDMAPMFDYSLLFVSTLLDYFNATKDRIHCANYGRLPWNKSSWQQAI